MKRANRPCTPAADSASTIRYEPPGSIEESGPDASPEPLPQSIAGYDVQQQVGRGGMGVVYLARHRVSQRLVAVKRVLPQAVVSTPALQMFLREVSVLSRLRHRRIVELIEFGLWEERPFLVMEYLPAVDVLDRLEAGDLVARVRIATAMTCRVLEALQFAHEQGIVHRDVKPSNVLAFRSGRKLQVKLSDFGLAKNYLDAGFSGITGENETRGTFAFMPPEQVHDSRNVQPACDIFSAGACLYFYLTGHSLYSFQDSEDPVTTILKSRTTPVRNECPGLPGDLAAAIERATEPRPDDRFGSAEEMRSALLKYTRKS